MQEVPRKILLGILVSNGDCLMATVLARQIKKDYPGSLLTWAISSRCRQMIDNNPHVDDIWEIELDNVKDAVGNAWYHFRDAALLRKEKGEFSEIFFVQVYPDNVAYFDGTTRGTIYNAYPHPVTVDARPVLQLTSPEIKNVQEFAALHRLNDYEDVILFECSSLSSQSFVTTGWAMAVAEQLVSHFGKLVVIISTHIELKSPHQRIIIASTLSLRENAELTKYCTLLAGCSSGITWIATSDWAKRLPMVQFINRGVGFTFASVAYDHHYWGLDDSRIIETTNRDVDTAVELISAILVNGIDSSRRKYHQHLKPRFLSLLKYWFMFFRKGRLGASWRVARNFIKRNYIRKRRRA
jgi:hypothetical protein